MGRPTTYLVQDLFGRQFNLLHKGIARLFELCALAPAVKSTRDEDLGRWVVPVYVKLDKRSRPLVSIAR